MLSYMREMLYLLATTLFVLSRVIVDPIFTLYKRQIGATGLEVGLIPAASYVILMFLRIPSGLLSNKIERKSMIFIAIDLRFFSVLLLYLAAEPFSGSLFSSLCSPFSWQLWGSRTRANDNMSYYIWIQGDFNCDPEDR